MVPEQKTGAGGVVPRWLGVVPSLCGLALGAVVDTQTQACSCGSGERESQPRGAPTATISLCSRVQGKEGTTPASEVAWVTEGKAAPSSWPGRRSRLTEGVLHGPGSTWPLLGAQRAPFCSQEGGQRWLFWA